MNQPNLAVSEERIVETMIALARCSKLHRIVVAGSQGAHLISELHRRGYYRVATTATCGLTRSQYDVAFVEWQLNAIKALETALDWLVRFLAPTSVLVIWVDSHERTAYRKLGLILEGLGFRIEAGTPCEHGLAVAARRLNANQQVIAA
jgi:hypothetical protein